MDEKWIDSVAELKADPSLRNLAAVAQGFVRVARASIKDGKLIAEAMEERVPTRLHAIRPWTARMTEPLFRILLRYPVSEPNVEDLNASLAELQSATHTSFNLLSNAQDFGLMLDVFRDWIQLPSQRQARGRSRRRASTGNALRTRMAPGEPLDSIRSTDSDTRITRVLLYATYGTLCRAACEARFIPNRTPMRHLVFMSQAKPMRTDDPRVYYDCPDQHGLQFPLNDDDPVLHDVALLAWCTIGVLARADRKDLEGIAESSGLSLYYGSEHLSFLSYIDDAFCVASFNERFTLPSIPSTLQRLSDEGEKAQTRALPIRSADEFRGVFRIQNHNWLALLSVSLFQYYRTHIPALNGMKPAFHNNNLPVFANPSHTMSASPIDLSGYPISKHPLNGYDADIVFTTLLCHFFLQTFCHPRAILVGREITFEREVKEPNRRPYKQIVFDRFLSVYSKSSIRWDARDRPDRPETDTLISVGIPVYRFGDIPMGAETDKPYDMEDPPKRGYTRLPDAFRSCGVWPVDPMGLFVSGKEGKRRPMDTVLAARKLLREDVTFMSGLSAYLNERATISNVGTDAQFLALHVTGAGDNVVQVYIPSFHEIYYNYSKSFALKAQSKRR